MTPSVHDKQPDTAPPRAMWLKRLVTAFNTNKTSWIGLVIFVIITIMAIFAPLFAPHDPLEQDLFAKLKAPFDTYYLGTDYYGRDIYSRLLYGARISLIIGIASTALALVIGSMIGITCGWYGGRFDVIIMQMMDMLLAFPSLILGLILVAMLGPTMFNIILAIALTSIPSFARIARAPTISVKQRDFIDAGRSLGFSDFRLMARHILPNIFPEILVMGSLWLASAIRTEASLAFIGLGVKPPIPTWGGMIREGFENILDSTWLVLAPSLAILVVVFALQILGDGLRDAIDPKLKGEQ